MNLIQRFGHYLAGLGGGAGVNNTMVQTMGWPGTMNLWASGLGQTFGPAVTDWSAMQVGTVFGCLSRKAAVISQMPLHHYRMTPDGDRERVQPASDLWWLLNESPCDTWTAAAWREWIVRCVELRGDQHTEILRRGATIIGFKPHHPDLVQPVLKDGRLRYYVTDMETGKGYGVDQDDMLHFTGFGFDGLRSISAIQWAGRNAVASSLGAEAYMGKTVTEGGMPRVAIEYPDGRKLDEPMAAALRSAWLEIYGGGQGGKIPLVLPGGAKARELSISPVDLELMQSRKMDKQTICDVLGVPPIILGDSEKTSSWGTGVEQVTIGWLKFVVLPRVGCWSQEINRKVFRRAGQYVEFNASATLQGDSKAQSEAFRAALGGPGTGDGWMTLNEVRRLLNMPRLIDPEADKVYRAPANPVQATQPTAP